MLHKVVKLQNTGECSYALGWSFSTRENVCVFTCTTSLSVVTFVRVVLSVPSTKFFCFRPSICPVSLSETFFFLEFLSLRLLPPAAAHVSWEGARRQDVRRRRGIMELHAPRQTACLSRDISRVSRQQEMSTKLSEKGVSLIRRVHEFPVWSPTVCFGPLLQFFSRYQSSRNKNFTSSLGLHFHVKDCCFCHHFKSKF